MKLAPVVLFVYNRRRHTEQTINALRHNELVDQSDLYVFSDGPRTDDDIQPVASVRKYLRKVHGFKSITLIERDRNWGLAKSIISGVTEIISDNKKVIVLEDDIVTSIFFLRYMNDALDHYQDNEKAMHISGYMFPINPENLPETFFITPTSCWGWGTWDRAWKHFEKNSHKILKTFTPDMINKFNLNGAHNYFAQIKKNHLGKINTWAIFWHASVFLNNGLSLHPAISMTQNIGHDKSGTHCSDSSSFDVCLARKKVKRFPGLVQENILARKRLETYYRSQKKDFLKLFGNYMARLKNKYLAPNKNL